MLATRQVKTVLGKMGLEVHRTGHDWTDTRTFLPLEATLSAAKASGLSVADYVDARYNQPRASQVAVDDMKAMGAFEGTIERVCEIGPGSGRYLEKIKAICTPAYYEIYETAQPWARWLVDTYGVTLQPTDGETLASTPSASIDLVHAHKVFVSTSFLVTLRYFDEMARVTRPGGRVLFDVMTEDCVDDDIMHKWLAVEFDAGFYPSIVPKRTVVDFFRERGLHLVASKRGSMEPGFNEVFLFER